MTDCKNPDSRQAHVTPACVNPHSHRSDGPIDEDAYRRGFQQGFETALQGIANGIAARRLERWRMAIYRWRFMRTHKQRIEPPQIKQAK